MPVPEPGCECCDRNLPPDRAEARIFSFECTFCADCADIRLCGVCPNRGGNLARRPIRPADKPARFPASTDRAFRPEGCAA